MSYVNKQYDFKSYLAIIFLCFIIKRIPFFKRTDQKSYCQMLQFCAHYPSAIFAAVVRYLLVARKLVAINKGTKQHFCSGSTRNLAASTLLRHNCLVCLFLTSLAQGCLVYRGQICNNLWDRVSKIMDRYIFMYKLINLFLHSGLNLIFVKTMGISNNSSTQVCSLESQCAL